MTAPARSANARVAKWRVEMLRRTLQLLRRCNRGTAAIEFCIVASVFTILITGMCDFGFAFFQEMQVESAAAAGVQYAVLNGYQSPGAGIKSIVHLSTNLAGVLATANPPSEFCGCPNVSPSATTITSVTCGSTCSSTGATAGTYVQVNARASYTFMMPWPGIPNPLTLSSTMTARIN
jgi:Flp pilus assembly protein TadG